jgi:hypothetical protein
MVFHFRNPSGSEPLAAGCEAIAAAYGLWENTGVLLGYFALRGEFSIFTGANVFSIHPGQRASFIQQPFSRPGLIPDLEASLLATSLAPVMTWATAERGPHTGRTYALGITEFANEFNSDREEVNFLYRDALTSIFKELGPAVEAATGYVLCHYTESPRGGVGAGPHLLDITDVGTYVLMGSQRRRTRK